MFLKRTTPLATILYTICCLQGVSTSLGTGAVKIIMKEDALLKNDIDQDQFDMLLSNLRMDSVFVKENMRIKWVSETGIVENLPKIVKEYRESRKLLVRFISAVNSSQVLCLLIYCSIYLYKIILILACLVTLSCCNF